MDFFDSLPICAIINGQFIALHGGISPELKTLNDLNNLDRYKEPPKLGLFCDILWSDPFNGTENSSNKEFIYNENRGCSYVFGTEALSRFLYQNKLKTLIRAHELQHEGFKLSKWKNSTSPQTITIFSAPNYCGTHNNKGAILTLKVI